MLGNRRVQFRGSFTHVHVHMGLISRTSMSYEQVVLSQLLRHGELVVSVGQKVLRPFAWRDCRANASE
jgi:hypothetical protein